MRVVASPGANLPLTEATLFILLSLSPGPKHGYAIMKDVQVLSDDRISFSTGTLYGALKRLLEHDWIERVDDPHPNDTARERKAYAVTRHGRRVLEAEMARLKKILTAAQRRAVEAET